MLLKASHAIAFGAAVAGLLHFAFSAHANERGPPRPADGQIDALTASVAMYCDPLLAKVLITSTYPLEIDEAANWLRRNPGLAGRAFDKTLSGQSWDQSVKDLARVPAVLLTMDDRLEWTQNLGDAFLAQPDLVMQSVQRLRIQARTAGRLRSASEQKIVLDRERILVQPTVFQLVYVPVYDPRVVFGKWPYTAYPPDWWPPPGYALGAGVVFMTGVAVSPSFWRNAIDWRSNRVLVKNALEAGYFAGRSVEEWRHDPRHRRNVPYPTAALRERYRHRDVPGMEVRSAYRGFENAQQRFSRAEVYERASRKTGPVKSATATNPNGSAEVFNGLGNGAQTHAFSDRGNASLAESNARLLRRR